MTLVVCICMDIEGLKCSWKTKITVNYSVNDVCKRHKFVPALFFFLRYKVHRYCEGVAHKKTYLIFISDSLTQRKFKSWCCVVWYTFQREDRDCSISLTENFLSIPADDRSLDLYWHTLLIRSCIQWST